MIHKSFLKWAGGKTKILSQLKQFVPKNYNKYLEPFLGGGALFFHTEPDKSVLSDINRELINLYIVLRDNLDELVEDLKKHRNNEKYYYHCRNQDRNLNYNEWSNVRKASRVLYLNKTCWNGLYRVNSSGYFNVPFGKRINPNIIDKNMLENCSKTLKTTTIRACSFEHVLDYVSENDFVYCIPEGSQILQNGLYLPIENIKKKANLGNNNYCLKLHKRKTINEEITNIKVMGLGNRYVLSFSRDHIVFVYDKLSGVVLEKKADSLKIGDYVIIDTDHKNESIFPIYESKNKHRNAKTLNIDYTKLHGLAELLGFYTAEGHSQKGLTFSFNALEENYLKRVQQLVKSVFGIDSVIYEHCPIFSVSQIKVFSVEIEKYFKENLITGLSTNKRLSDIVMLWPKDVQFCLLKSWLKGDGGIWYGQRNRVKITGTTASNVLAQQLYQIALRNKLKPNIKIRYSRKNGKTNTVYDLYFSTLDDYNKITNNNISGRDRSRRKWVDGVGFTSPITDKYTTNYSGNMYDLTTSKGCFYMNFGVKVHNCDPPYTPLKKGSFTNYSKGGFNEKDQINLKMVCDVINKRSAYFVLSNSYVPFILDLYKDYDTNVVYAPRSINRNGNCRGVIKEVVVTNYNN